MTERLRKSVLKGLASGLLSLTAVVVGPVQADQLIGHYKIRVVFAEASDTGGFYLTEDLPQCLFGLMYLDLSSSAGKARFAIN